MVSPSLVPVWQTVKVSPSLVLGWQSSRPLHWLPVCKQHLLCWSLLLLYPEVSCTRLQKTTLDSNQCCPDIADVLTLNNCPHIAGVLWWQRCLETYVDYRWAAASGSFLPLFYFSQPFILISAIKRPNGAPMWSHCSDHNVVDTCYQFYIDGFLCYCGTLLVNSVVSGLDHFSLTGAVVCMSKGMFVFYGWVRRWSDYGIAPLRHETNSIMTWYPTQSHYPGTEPTSPCPALVMRIALWLSRRIEWCLCERLRLFL